MNITKGSRFLRAALIAAAIGLVAAGCTTPSSGGPPPPPEVPVWMTGDSNSASTGHLMPTRPWVGSVGAAGYTASSRSMVVDDIIASIDAYGPPETVLVMAGVIDVARGVLTSEITAGMQSLEDEMTSRGIEVVWVAEPGWAYQAGLQELADWINAKPLSVDCRHLAGAPTSDGVHALSYDLMAACVADEVTALGITW